MSRKNVYPATEKQLWEWEYTKKKKNYLGNIFFKAIIENASYETIQGIFSLLVERHESLRTTFYYSNKMLKQIVHSKDFFDFKIEFQDLSKESDQDDKLKILLEEFARFKINLTKGPLFKVLLVRIGNSKHAISLIIHHIISDDMSIDILKNEFSILYESFINNLPVALEPLPFQMKDYALWEKETNMSVLGQANLQYWNYQLSGKFYQFKLSPDIKRKYCLSKAENSSAGGKNFWFFDNTLLAEMKKLCKNQFLVIVATLVLWIAYLSNKRRILLAIPFSTRHTNELTNVVGYLISEIYLIIELPKDWNFKEVIALVIKSYSDAITHRYYSKRSLNVRIPPSHYCVSVNNVTNIKQEKEYNDFSLKHLEIEEEPFLSMQFSLSDFKNGWLMSCYYKSRLFKNVCVSNLFDRYVEVTHLAIENPDVRISKLLSN